MGLRRSRARVAGQHRPWQQNGAAAAWGHERFPDPCKSAPLLLPSAEAPGGGAEDVAEELDGEVVPEQAVGAEARVGGHGDSEDPLLRPRGGIRVALFNLCIVYRMGLHSNKPWTCSLRR